MTEGEETKTPTGAAAFGLLLRFWQFVRPHKRWIALGVSMIPLVAAMSTLRPLLLKHAIDESIPSTGPTQHEEMVATELLERYEAALARLKPDYREAIIARLELGLPWPEVMDALHKPSIPAAQMTVSRAIMRLAEEMSYERKS